MHRKWLITTLFAAILLPVMLIAAALLFLSTTDLSQHRDTIAEHISALVGRRLSLNGELDLNIASTSSFVMTDITLANAEWASAQEMLVIQRIEAEIELWPLLRGDIFIPRFHLEGVEALLETDTSGSGNWVLTQPVNDQPDSDATVSTASLKRPWIDDVSIVNVELIYRDAQTGNEVTVKLDHARLNADKPESPATIDIVGQVNSHPVEINGKFALPAVLTAANVNVPIELHASVLDLKADASGSISISGTAQAPAIDLEVHAEAASLKQLRQVFGDVIPEVKPVKLVMAVKGDRGEPVSCKLNATAGKGKLEAELSLQRSSPRPRLTGAVAISDIDVLRLWATKFAEEPAATELNETPTPSSATSLGLDQPVDLAWLGSLDANLTLSVMRVNLPQIRITNLQSRFIIDDRQLRIDELKLITDAGTVTTALSLNARDRPTAAQLDLKTSTVMLGKLPPLAENQYFKHSRAQADISVTAKGETVAALIENLQGIIQLDYEDKTRKEKLSLHLTRIPEQITTDKTRFVVTADGHLNEQAIELRGHVIPPASLLNSAKPYEIDFALQAFGVTGKVTGTAAALYTLDGLDLAVQARADDLNGLRKAFGEAIPNIGKTDLSARFKSEQSKLRLSALRVGLDEGHIDGWLVLDTADSISDLKAELTFVDLDLDKLLAKLDQQADSKKTTAAKTTAAKTTAAKTTVVKTDGDRLFSDEPLPFDALSRARISATLRASNLEYNNRHLQEAELSINMASGKLSASLVKLSSVTGELVGDFVIDASNKDAPGITIKLQAPQVELGELLIVDDGSSAIEGPLAVDIFLEGRGRSVAQIMATLTGNVKLLMEQGSADAKALDLFVGGLSAMFGTIFTEESSRTRIECAICDLKLEQGMLTPRLAVLDTQYSTVITEGQVDLGQEQLNLKVSPQAKGVTLSVAFPVLVKGTLSNPDVDVDKTGALLKAGELWATVVYPPAALLKFSDLGDGKPNPCVSMVAEKAGIPIIEDVGKVVKGTVKGVGSAVKGVGSGLGKFIEAVKEGGDSPTIVDEDADKAIRDDLDDPDLFMDY